MVKIDVHGVAVPTRAGLVAGLIALAVVTGARAQQAPQPPAQAQKLWSFAGDWEGQATVVMGGKTTTAAWRHTCKKVDGGWGLEGVEHGTLGDAGPYVSNYIIGWEGGRDLVHLYSVDNFGDTHDHVGSWKDADTLELRYEGVQDGKPMIETISITLDKPTGYHFSGTTTIDGKVDSTLSATMRPRTR